MKLLAIALIALATTAHAAQVWVDADNNHIQRPTGIGQTANPTDGQLAAHDIRQVAAPDDVDERFWVWGGEGFVSMPQAEIDAILAADAEAQAAADALKGPEPEVIVPLVNADLEPIGTARIVVLEGSMAILASTNSASPQRLWEVQREQLRAVAQARTMMDSKLAEASAFADKKAKAEASAKLEAVAAEMGGKKRSTEDRLSLIEKVLGIKEEPK